MSNKLAFFEGMSPEQKGALIGSLMGAGVGGLGGAIGSKKNKLRNSLLAALAGGAGGAGLGYLGGSYFPQKPIQDISRKTAPGVANALNVAASGASNPALGLAGATTEAIKNLPSKDKVMGEFDKLRQKFPVINNYLQGQPAMEEAPFQAVPEPSFLDKATDKLNKLKGKFPGIANNIANNEAMGEEAYSGPLSGMDTAPTGRGADANAMEQARRAARLLAPLPGGAGFLNTIGGMEEAAQRTP